MTYLGKLLVEDGCAEERKNTERERLRAEKAEANTRKAEANTRKVEAELFELKKRFGLA
ncbi:MAG: hypothetical protein LUI13_01030 [Lachnospiraceae bacterium]|nr:hypothetical protein [Lachnospiraceae bacterium]